MSATSSTTRRHPLLSRLADIRPEETPTVLLMFGYAFAIMTAYNIVQPVTRSAFIDDLGATNLPYVLLAAGLAIGVIMQGYDRVVTRLPPRWALPTVQLALTALILVFFVLFQRGGQWWVSSCFFLFGQILGTLLLSQFWTLANEVYDPRQARRIFGFIGGGASLGGMAGSGLAILLASRVGTPGLLLASAVALVAAACTVMAVLSRESGVRNQARGEEVEATGSLREALQLVRDDPSLRLSAWLVSFAAIGSVFIDQQLNMAAEQFRGTTENSVTSFLASVRFLLSTVSLLLQVFFVKQVYRLLGVGVALLALPVSLGITGGLILFSGALWAATLASVVDRSIRYTVDRTTREIFFLPLASAVRARAKPFIDVTVDRVARGVGAVLVLLLLQGLSLPWPTLSALTLVVVGLWLAVAYRARHRYVTAIRQGLESRAVQPSDVRVDVADLTTVEALLEELAHPDERRVLYAIDVLESLDKRNLITPLLLHHEAPAVRARALSVISTAHETLPDRWHPMIGRMVRDPDPDVRARAIVALAQVERRDATKLARDLLNEDGVAPRVAVSAAIVLAGSDDPTDVETAEATLGRLGSDPHDDAADTRRDVAGAIRQIESRRIRHLLIPLLQDPVPEVAEEAMRTIAALRPLDALFIPTLISLLGDRRLKSDARDALVSYGEPVLNVLNHVMSDPSEDPWVRRHLPATIARIPCQRAMDTLVDRLDDPDPLLRDKAIKGMRALRRWHPGLTFPAEPVDALLVSEARRYFGYVTLRHDVFGIDDMAKTTLLYQVLTEKMQRAVERSYRLLALLHPWKDIAIARQAIDHGDRSTKAHAFEYLDNILAGHLRHSVMPMLEDLPADEKVRSGHLIRRTHPSRREDALLALINDADQVVAAAAIDLVRSERQWTLTEDVEHVLAHRPVQDWVVFEAASWTLAERRLTHQERQARWLEPLPAIVLADRVRHLPMFQSVSIDEICRLASTGRQLRHDDQAVLLREGVVPEAFHVLLDGRVTIHSRSSETRRVVGPFLIGFDPALEGAPAPETVRAEGPIVTAAVRRGDLLTLLTGNSDIVRGLFRTIAESDTRPRTPVVVKGNAKAELPRAPVTSLTPVQRMLTLQQIPTFATLPSAEIAQLSAIARNTTFEAGDVLWKETDPPVCCVVVSGSLSVRDGRNNTEQRARPGDTVGLFETLAGAPLGGAHQTSCTLVVETSGTALQLEEEELFDLIEHRPRLLQHLFATVFGSHTAL